MSAIVAALTVIFPLLMQIPSLVENAIRVVNILRTDPATPEEARVELDDISVRLVEIVQQVREVPLVPVIVPPQV